MKRRDMAATFFASAVGSAFVEKAAQAQTCTAPCYSETSSETAAGVVIANSSYYPGNVLRYGADSTGATDSTTAFQYALSSNGNVYAPDGRYTITTNRLTMPVGVEIILSKGAIISASSSSSGYVFNCSGSNSISGGTYSSSNDYPVIANAVGAVNNVSLYNIIANGPRLLYAFTSSNYAGATDSNSPSAITVEGCVATHTTVNTTIACVYLGYCRFSHAIGNHFYNCVYGVEFWGGDASDTGDDTSISVTRKCRNIRIEGNNYVSNGSGKSAFWGSMGTNICIIGNTAYGGSNSDVGIDVEGCINATISGNTSQDFINGCFTVFSYNRGIVFVGNAAIATNKTYALFTIFNVSGAVTNNFDITVTGNSFTCLSGVGAISNQGPCRTLSFNNNTCTNVQFAFAPTSGNPMNFNRICIKDNVWIYDTNPGVAFNAIDTTGCIQDGAAGHLAIEGNDISALFTPAAGSIGIRVNTYDYNASSTVEIDNNRISQFPTDIAIVETGTNAGIAGNYLIRRNRVDSGVFTRTESGAKPMTAILEDNHLYNGAPFPGSIPTTQRWDVAQRIWYGTPAAASAPGAICVTAGVGTAAVWKSMAPLSS